MKKIIDYIAEELSEAFEKAGYDRTYGKVTLSNRPDLCEYQCNGAMAGAKAYEKSTVHDRRGCRCPVRRQCMYGRSRGCKTWIYQYQTEKVICCRLSESDGRDG